VLSGGWLAGKEEKSGRLDPSGHNVAMNPDGEKALWRFFSNPKNVSQSSPNRILAKPGHPASEAADRRR